MSIVIVCLALLGVTAVAVKVYFQEKQNNLIESQTASQAEEKNLADFEKTNEEIVAERLAEIAQFEKEVEDKKAVEKTDGLAKDKNKPKQKKVGRPAKQQPKLKAK